MFPSQLPIVMNRLGEAERVRAAENARRRGAFTHAQRRFDLRPLRVPRFDAKGFARRSEPETVVRSA